MKKHIKLKRRRTFLLLACILTGSGVSAQPAVSFEMTAYHVLDAEHRIETFGGISAIERRADGKGMLLLGDHYTDGQSYLFLLDGNRSIEAAAQPAQLEDAESFRIDPNTGINAYSFEGDQATGLVTIVQTPGGRIRYDTLSLQTIPGKHTTSNLYTTYNRGIEGLAFAADSSLWMAFESGGDTSCGSSLLAFRKYHYDSNTQNYSSTDYTEYSYPIDRCICTQAHAQRKFDGSLGNGVSEILFLPGSSDKLLVLERCFDGRSGYVTLWLAQVPTGGRVLTKALVFDFNHTDDEAFSSFKPDNLEGMCWGSEEQEYPVLYLVSDDNYRRNKQQTQLVQLRMRARNK